LDESNKKIKSLEDKLSLSTAQLDEHRKSNAELQKRINELLENSGDSSSRLMSLNENLQQKEKYIEDLQLNLNNACQDLATLKNETETSANKLNDEIQKLTKQNEELVSQLKATVSEHGPRSKSNQN
jgi:predicted  nucleic acid-binding Zn-ribbon protein